MYQIIGTPANGIGLRISGATTRSGSALRGDLQTVYFRRGDATPIWGEFTMVISKITTGVLLGIAMALVSCVPKATVVAQPPAPPKKVVKDLEGTFPEPPVPSLPGEEIRMPDGMVDLPSDAEFRATAPIAPRSDPGGGSIFVRPPTDPPSRVKPKPAE